MKIFNTKTLIALGLIAFTAIDSVASISMKSSNDEKTKDVSASSKQETSGSSSTSISPNTRSRKDKEEGFERFD